MPSLFIRSRVRVLEGHLTEGPNITGVEVRIGESPVLTASLASDPDESRHASVTVTGEYQVDQNWITLVQEIVDEIFPPGFIVGVSGSLYDYYPQELQEFCDSTTATQHRSIQRFIDLVRWRLPSFGWAGDRIIRTKPNTAWSTNKSAWHRLHVKSRFAVSGPYGGLRLTTVEQEAVRELVDAGESEPLGRELWHSALSSWERGDSRMAIVVAVSAVEVELKRFISQVAPQAEWLVTKLPSPPIVQIIKNYLPLLGISEDRLPPKRVRSVLDTAVQLRNEFIHFWGKSSADRGATEVVGSEEAPGILRACSDVLWLLDVYRCHSWAMANVTGECRAAMNIPVGQFDEVNGLVPVYHGRET